jgi:hypothetical protein
MVVRMAGAEVCLRLGSVRGMVTLCSWDHDGFRGGVVGWWCLMF